MKAAELKVFKQALLEIRARLRGDVSTMADAALRRSDSDGGGNLSTMPIHMADLGSDAFEQEFTLSLMATEEGTLEAVEEALERIRTKSFGLCEGCGGIISKKRLEAIPFAALCIKCAELEESHGPVRRTPVRPPARAATGPARPVAGKSPAKTSRPRHPR
jgi:DnaK suppressor protein